MSEVFLKLSAINVSNKTEKKQGLTYLSWPLAWAEVCKSCNNVTYTVVKDNETGLPYVYDDATGFIVFTTVTIDGTTHEMWLPVMDGANKAMKKTSYNYKTKRGDKTCVAGTMFDVNKTIMRCLVKNLAMFGLGLNIYAGEDLPLTITLDDLTPAHQDWELVREGVASGKNRDYVEQYYNITNDIWSALNS